MFGFFSKKAEKREVDQLKQAVQADFNSVKQDINNSNNWIKYLNNENSNLKNEIFELNSEISSIKEEIDGIKNIMSIVGERQLFKQRQTVFNKQTAVYGVQTPVQTGVQAVFFDKILGNMTASERAIIFVLLNSDMKLSYEDLSAMLGKTKTTIRGQINSIRQKSEGLIEETTNKNNKKRIFINEKAKEILLKSRKIKEKNKKKGVKETEDKI